MIVMLQDPLNAQCTSIEAISLILCRFRELVSTPICYAHSTAKIAEDVIYSFSLSPAKKQRDVNKREKE
jgi:hypothetical protein